MTGRFATGRTHWVIDFGLRLDGWTPDQQARYADQLRALLDDPARDVPTCRWAIERLAALAFAPPAALARYAADPRPPVRDIAIRALPSLDGPEGLDTLLGCMGDDRARIATYALRRSLTAMPRAEILRRLGQVPLERVTIAKEVLRLMGELCGPLARDRLVQIGQGNLHRDVRLALLRALWDHIEHPPAWALLEAAATDPDPIMAGRLLAIPMDRLSTPADARLCTLFGQVLARPEPEARIGFLSLVAQAPLRDQSRVLFNQLVLHLGTADPTEASLALHAVLARMQPGEVPRVVARVAGLLPRRELVRALVIRLASTLHPWSPGTNRALGEALAPVLAADRHSAELAIRLFARVRDATGFAAGLDDLLDRGHLHHDAVAAAISLVDTFATPDALARRLFASPDPRLRRIALAALVAAAAPENGWTAPRRELLGRMQADPSLELAAAAAWVFPPP